MIAFDYIKPSNAKGAIEALAKSSSSKFIAGGTNLVDLMKMGVTRPDKLIDITGLPFSEVEKKAGSLRIGSLALNSTVSENELVLQYQPLLSLALKAGASPQLRNMATVGGNMMQRTRCSYFFDLAMPCNKRQPGSGCGALHGYNRMHAIFGASDKCIAVHPSDMCVALTALDATVYVTGPKGDRIIPFADFHRLPGDQPDKDNTLQREELIEAVEIPDNQLNKHVHYLKVRDRASYAFALVSVAVGLDLNGEEIRNVRIAMGGVAHKPWRLKEAEHFLIGKKASQGNFEQAAKIAMRGAKGYGYNNFKLKLAPNAITEALNKATAIS